MKKPPKRRPDPPSKLELRNPHAVHAAIRARPQDVIEVRVRPEDAAPAWKRVVAAAGEAGVRVRPPEPPAKGKRPPREGRNTAASALVKPKAELPLAELLALDGCVWLLLEHVQDPHNVGAILRTAGFFGVAGVLLTKDQSASVTAVACDTAAGGAEAVPVTTVTNVSRTLDAARDAGLWVLGTSEHAEQPLSSVSADRKWLAVLGNEESGLRRLTKEKCDVLVGVPGGGPVGSLNVGVAAGIVLHALSPT